MNDFLMTAKRKGLRLTALRKQLFSLLSATSKPVSVPELTDVLSVNKTTLYREMETLIAHSLVQPVDFGDGKTRYELTRDDHHHFICETCGSVQDIEECAVDAVAAEIEKQKGVRITRHALEFFGLCTVCMRRDI